LELTLKNIKELASWAHIFGMIGRKNFNVNYKGFLKINCRGEFRLGYKWAIRMM
jgi:hypothetical protein